MKESKTVKVYNCTNCNKEMKVDINPYFIDDKGNNTAKKTFYGTWVCSEDCEQEHDGRMRREAEHEYFK